MSYSTKNERLHESWNSRMEPPLEGERWSHENIIEETAVLAQHFVPELGPTRFRGLHARYRKDVDVAFATGREGKDLADKINEPSARLEKELTPIVGPEAYKKLTGLKAVETATLMNPDLI